MAKSRLKRKTVKKLKLAAAAGAAVILILILFFLIRTNQKYVTIDLNDYFTYTYEGFDGKGSMVASFSGEEVRSRIMEGYDDYAKDYLNFSNNITSSDYEALYKSISWQLDQTENLTNNQNVMLTYSHDEELAKKLRVAIRAEEQEIPVTGLVTAKTIRAEDLYKDVEVTYSGTAPKLAVKIKNNSTDEFLKTVSFVEATPGALYRLGDKITVNATWNDVQAVKLGYSIEAENSNCTKEYTVENVDTYVSEVSQIPQELIDSLVQKGAALINGTKCDYGLRVFTEAHLDYNLAGAAAPFTYSSPRTLSMYLKSIKPEAQWNEGYDFNNLDIIYAVTITQAGGMSCEAEAAVRVRNIILKADGTCVADLDSMEIATVSYNNNSVLKNVTDFYETNYNVEKKALNQ